MSITGFDIEEAPMRGGAELQRRPDSSLNQRMPDRADQFVARATHDDVRDVRIIQTIGSVGEWAGGPSRTVVGLSTSVGRLGYRVDLVAGYDARRDAALLVPDAQLTHFHRVPTRGALGVPLLFAYHAAVAALLTAARRVGAPVLI